jgi:transposase
MSKHNDTLERTASAQEGLRRVEVITGVGRRRRWSREVKARIVLESQQPGAVVSEVARQHGMTPQQLFGWRREVRDGAASGDAHDPPRSVSTTFAPIVVAEAGDHTEKVAGITAAGGGQIEIAIAGALIRLWGRCDLRALAAVLKAVRATS